MSKAVTLLETVYSPEAKVDREAGVIRNVKILGRESANGRTYSDKALDDAARLYEGRKICIDHDREKPKRERGVLEELAVISESRRQGDGVYGNLRMFTEHSAYKLVMERAEKFPSSFGLSHNGEGQMSRDGRIVESLSSVRTVDLVGDPATNKSLFESKDQAVPKTLKEIIESFNAETAKSCGILEMDGMGAMPVEVPSEGSGEDHIWAAFKQAINVAVDDDKLDINATRKKVDEILKAYEKLTGSASDSSGGDSKPSDTPTTESKEIKALAESVNLLLKRDKARGIIDELGIRPDSALLESLVKQPDEKAMKELAEREGAKLPTRTKPLVESRMSVEFATPAAPADAKGFAALVR